MSGRTTETDPPERRTVADVIAQTSEAVRHGPLDARRGADVNCRNPYVMCDCGHTLRWHSHDGRGDCEHDGACACQGFKDEMFTTGVAIKRAREARGMSLTALADAAGVSKGSLHAVEAGEQDITVGRLQKIAGALRLPAHCLISDAEARPDHSPETDPNPGAKPSNPSVVRPVRVKGKRER